MNGTATLPTSAIDESTAAQPPATDDLVDRVRQALATSGQAQPAPRGWVRRVQRTSPLETRYVSR